jgi:hypothetical protein
MRAKPVMESVAAAETHDPRKPPINSPLETTKMTRQRFKEYKAPPFGVDPNGTIVAACMHAVIGFLMAAATEFPRETGQPPSFPVPISEGVRISVGGYSVWKI